MINKKNSIIPVIFLVLLLTFNASTISVNNSVAAQYYDSNSLGSIQDILCNENETSETSQNGQGKPGILNDDNNPSSDGSAFSNTDSKPSGKTGKVITPPPAPTTPNEIDSIGDDTSKPKNTASYDNCSNTEDSNEFAGPITNNDLETPESGVPSISCGQVIEESVVLTSNLNCKSDGLLVGGDDITIDLNGFSVTGPSENSSKIGVMLTNTENVTVRGPGTISEFQAGILSTGGANNSISEIDFSDNHVGVFVTSSTDSTIEDNRLTNNSIGIVAYSSSNSSIDTNLLKSNELGGTALVDSDNNDIYLNTVKDSLNGIFIDAQSQDNNATFNNLAQGNEIDINNANGLPTNINNNEYKDNNCSVSLPNGLCHGSDLPNVNSNTSEVESINQAESGSPIQNSEESSGPEQVGADNDSSDEQKSIRGGVDDLSSGNNFAVQN